MKRSMHVPLLLAMGLSASLAACQLLLAIDDEQGVERPDGAVVSDAGGDVQLAEDASAPRSPDECEKGLPPISTGGGTNSTSEPDLHFVMQTIRMAPTGTSALGYNLDGLCSRADAESILSGGGCRTASNAPDYVHADFDEGVDNVFASLVSRMSGHFQSGQDSAALNFNDRVQRGYYSVFIDLYDYNGLADDPDVKVGFNSATALGHVTQGDAGGFVPGTEPVWDGNDQWTYAPAQLQGGRLGGMWRGFVKNHQLVIFEKVIASQLKFVLGNVEFELEKPIVTATLERGTDNVWYLHDAVLAGAATPEAVVRMIGHTTVDGAPLCNQPPPIPDVMPDVRGTICSALDLQVGTAGTTCDRMSFAVGFEAVQARRGGPREIDQARVSDCSARTDEWWRCAIDE